ncbi:MAG: Tol-Pal system beta propeller repeat protein TolB [Alphaproteobacteria bacterium]
MLKKVILGCCLMFGFTAQADLDATFSQGKLKPTPIALLKFQGDQDLAEDLKEVTENDLKRSGFFEPIPSESFTETSLPLAQPPQFESWKLIKTRLLLNGHVALTNDNVLIIQFQLWDVYSQKQMVRGTIKAKKKYWRRLAHIISDIVYKRVTGTEGYFDSRIVYIAETGPQLKRMRRLALMDQDGANHQYLTDEDVSVITPRFSPTEQKVAYMQYEKKSKLGKIRILDLETGKHEFIQQLPGITYAPRFSPDGTQLAFSYAEHGKSSLYLLDLKTKKILRLTNEQAIDTSPSFSPDGKKLVFNSDRGHKKQLYILDLKTLKTERISFGGGVYATPNWSPDGKWVAFTKIQKGTFYIGIMKPDGTHEKLIATGYLVEGPSWAPNSRTLCFYRQERWNDTGTLGGKAKIYSIDISGANQQEVKTPMDATDPSWSPPLPFEHLPQVENTDFEDEVL